MISQRPAVVFHHNRHGDFYVGRKPRARARITVDHIARHFSERESRHRKPTWIKNMLQLHLEPKAEIHWEFHVSETSEDPWMINGIAPPRERTDAEKLWAGNNSPFPY